MDTSRRSFLALGRSAAVAIDDTCLARRFVHCQSCGDACPEQAIGFRPRLGGPPLPRLVAARCTGCGECFSACPVRAIALVADRTGA